MFKTIIKNTDLSTLDFSGRLFPDVNDRAFWDAHYDEVIIAEAEKHMEYDWPIIKATDYMEFKKTGDRMIMEDIHFARRRALVCLSLGELMENKGRFLPQITNGIFTICEESYWGVSAHWFGAPGNIQSPEYPYIDLFAGETAENLAFISVLLRDPLLAFCPEIIDRIDYEMERRIFVPYLTHRDFWWMGYFKKVNNWNPWILSNVLSAFLLLERNPLRLRKAIEKILTEVTHYYDCMPADGGCDEGPGYWIRAGASLFEVLYQLKVATGGKLDLFVDEKVRNIGSYITKVYVGNGKVANFGDGSQNLSSITMIYAYGKETNQPQMCALAAEAVKLKKKVSHIRLSVDTICIRRSLLDLSLRQEILNTDTPFSPPALYYLPNLQVATLRNNGFVLGAKGGNNGEFHNHNDVGNFILYDNGTPVLVDAGVGDYTRQTFGKERYTIWTMQSGYHNLPTVNGIDQHDGWKFRADSFLAEEGRVTTSLPKAYPEESGLGDFTRTLQLGEAELSVTDRFTFVGENGSVVEHLMTPYCPEVKDNVVILDGKYEISCDGGAISVEDVRFDGNKKLELSWKSAVLYRINIAFEKQETVTIRVRRI